MRFNIFKKLAPWLQNIDMNQGRSSKTLQVFSTRNPKKTDVEWLLKILEEFCTFSLSVKSLKIGLLLSNILLSPSSKSVTSNSKNHFKFTLACQFEMKIRLRCSPGARGWQEALTGWKVFCNELNSFSLTVQEFWTFLLYFIQQYNKSKSTTHISGLLLLWLSNEEKSNFHSFEHVEYVNIIFKQLFSCICRYILTIGSTWYSCICMSSMKTSMGFCCTF